MKIRSRVWSVILTVALVCSVFTFMPAGAFAASGPEGAGVDAFGEGNDESQGGEGGAPGEGGNDGSQGSEVGDPYGAPEGDGADGSPDEGLPDDSGNSGGPGLAPLSDEPPGNDGGLDSGLPGDDGAPLTPFAGVVVKNATDLFFELEETTTTEIDLGANITSNSNKGIVVSERDLKINMNGYSLTITNTDGPGLSISSGKKMTFNSNGLVSTNVNITGKGEGIYANNGELLLTSETGNDVLPKVNATVSSAKDGHALAVNAANSTVEIYSAKDKGTAESVGVYSHESTFTVYGPVTLTGKESVGVYAWDSTGTVDGPITLSGQGGLGIEAYPSSTLDINAPVTLTGKGSRGINALGSTINISKGSAVKAASCGIRSAEYSTVNAAGCSITATGADGYGVSVYDYSSVYVGDITANGKDSYGVYANGDSEVQAGNIKAGGVGGTGVGAFNSCIVTAGNIDAVFKGAVLAVESILKAGSVRVTGATGIGIDASRCNTSGVTLTGDVLVSGKNGVGLRADGSKINFGGKVTTTNAASTGVITSVSNSKGGKITIDKGLFTPSGANAKYIVIEGAEKKKDQKEATSLKSGYFEYTDKPVIPGDDLANTVWVKDLDYRPVCEIKETGCQYDNFAEAVAAAAATTVSGDSNLITMLVDHTHYGGISINASRVRLDLNGKTLNIVNTAGTGLTVSGVNGRLALIKSANGEPNGELNVKGTTRGVDVTSYPLGGTDQFSVEVTNVTATGGAGSYAVYAKGTGDGNYYTSVHVFGDVRMTNTGTGSSGVWVQDGGKATVDGMIRTPTGVNGINAPFTATSVSQGYFQFTNNESDPKSQTSSTVWARDELNTGLAPDYYCEITHGGITKYYSSIISYNGVIVSGGAIFDVPAYYSLLSGGLPDYNAPHPGNERTIRLLKDFTYVGGEVVVNNKNIELDLNGYTLTVAALSTAGGSNCLNVYYGGVLKLRDPSNGKLNISGINGKSPVRVGASFNDKGNKAEVTNVDIPLDKNISGSTVNVSGSSELTVYGKITGCTTNDYRALSVGAGGKVTVFGKVTSYARNQGGSGGGIYAGTSVGDGDASVIVYGDVTLYGYEAPSSQTFKALETHQLDEKTYTASITVYGDVKAIGAANMRGAQTSNGTITVHGDMKVTGTNSRGVDARGYKSRIIIDGEMDVSEGTYIVTQNDSLYKQIDEYDRDNIGSGTPVTTRPGYLQYSDSWGNYVWVWDPAAGPAPKPPRPQDLEPVCQMGSVLYNDLGDALAAVPPYGGSSDARTIRLLRDIDYDSNISANNQRIEFDLNGFVLNVIVSGYSTALSVSGANGWITLLDPYNGELNAYIEAGAAVAATGTGNVVQLTNAYSKGLYPEEDEDTGEGVPATGVLANSGATVTVFGDVKAFGSETGHGIWAGGQGTVVTVHGDVIAPLSGGYGVYTASGIPTPSVKVTVEGQILATDGASYIYTPVKTYSKDEGVSDASKPGYLKYDGSANTVWVRDTAAFCPVTHIAGVPKEIVAGVPYTLAGEVIPAFATNKAILWSIEDAGGTGAALAGNVLTAKSPGTIELLATIANGKLDSGNVVAYEQTINIDVIDPPVSLVSVSPTHAILSNAGDEATFTAQLAPGHDNPDNYNKIEWKVIDPQDPNAPPVAAFSVSGGGKKASVYALDPLPAAGKTVQVIATYDKAHIATATVELLPDLSNLNIKLLETKATVNKAKEVGALVPVLISKQPDAAFGINALSIGSFGYSEPEAAGSIVIEEVNLFTQNSRKEWVPVGADVFEARMYGFDDRYIVIDALAKAKSMTVRVTVTTKGAPGTTFNAGTLALTVTEKYPKITLKAGQLNLAFPDQAAALTATSPDGACLIKGVGVPWGTVKYDLGSNEFRLDGQKKTGTVKPTVEVAVEGYKKAYKTAPKVSVKVVNTLPSVKLSPASVKLMKAPDANGAATVKLITGNKKVPFESGYKVTGVTCVPNSTNKSKVEVSYSAGVLSIRPASDCVKGKARLAVWFEGSSKPRYLILTVSSVVDPWKTTTAVKPTTKVTKATVNTGHVNGAKIVDIPISLGVANHVMGDWEVTFPANSYQADLAAAIGVTQGRNSVSLYVKDQAKLKDLLTASNGNKTHTLKIGSEDLVTPVSRATPYTFDFKLTVTDKAPTMTVATKGKVDIANPASAVTVTVSTKNAAPDIAKVELFTTAAAATASPDFRVASVSGKTFKVAAAHKQLVPGVSKSVYAKVTLKNGLTITSKIITVKPSQTKSKATQGKKTVSLYKLDPLRGQTTSLGLKTPANVKLGAVQLKQSTLNGFKLYKADFPAESSNGFRLEQSGGGNWTIYFAEDKAPKKKNGAKLGSSYTLQIELWADGTYTLDKDGKAVALKSGSKKSAPTTVKVKVAIK